MRKGRGDPRWSPSRQRSARGGLRPPEETKRGRKAQGCGSVEGEGRRFLALRPRFPPAWPGNRLPLGTRRQRGGQLPWLAAGRQDAARLPPLPYAWMPSPEGTGAPWWGAASGP